MHPTFIIIGAMKGGTTALYHYLKEHPEVVMSRVKETNFFLGRHEYDRGFGWYGSLFPDDAAGSTAVGEASPNYTKRHLWPGVPERIREAFPEIRLIYVVRDPIERVVSNYIHNYAHGREGRPLSEVITAESSYVKTSMYAYQLDAYLDVVPADHILVLDSTALRSDTATVLRGVFEFIGVRADFGVPNLEERYHVSSKKLRSPVLARYVEHPRLRRLLRPFLPSRLTEPRPFSRPVLSSDDVSRLEDALGADTERFRGLTGMSFSHWSV